MAYSSCMLLAVLTLGLLTNAHLHEDLADRYSNYKLLSSPSYELYWSVDEPTGNLSLAVRVNTTGWVGFGVSPNGGMPNSDVVMGWVEDDGTVVFQVSPLQPRHLLLCIVFLIVLVLENAVNIVAHR